MIEALIPIAVVGLACGACAPIDAAWKHRREARQKQEEHLVMVALLRYSSNNDEDVIGVAGPRRRLVVGAQN
jgi:hypothetical protein